MFRSDPRRIESESPSGTTRTDDIHTSSPRTVLVESPEQAHVRRLRASLARWERVAEQARARHLTTQLSHAETMVELTRRALESSVC